MNKSFLIPISLFFLISCNSFQDPPPPPPPPPPPTPITIPDVSIYLSQYRCPNGSPPHLCSNPQKQKVSDPIFFRRQDHPLPGYQISDSVISDDGNYYITTFSYPPYKQFTATNGDGGEVYVNKNETVSICCTQDGGKPGLQRFDSWWLFDNKTPSSTWFQADPKSRARRETVTFPASGFGLKSITADTIISEHFDHLNFEGKMERIYLSKNWGRLLWQAWVPPELVILRPPPSDLSLRCPTVSYSGPPAEKPNWILYDCRLTTNLVPWNGTFSIKEFSWPESGFTP